MSTFKPDPEANMTSRVASRANGDSVVGAARKSVLQIVGLSKTFPGTKALDDVSLEIGEAEIHALVGQNGSGKSTLIKVLAGYHHADPGAQLWLFGESVDLAKAALHRHHRLRFVHQDLGLFLELGATDNVALRSSFVTSKGRIRWRKQADLTRELLSSFGVDLQLNRPLGELTPVQRTIVAIAAALSGWEGGPGVLVLDEPTAVLPPADVVRLLSIIERVRSRGASILYVSHRLDEVFTIADRVTVLRGGRVIVTRPVAGLNRQSLAELMVGSDVDASYRAELPQQAERPVMLRARNVRGRFLDGVDVDLYEGEILGVVGLPGSGRSELPYALVGALPGATGELQVGDSRPVPLKKAASFDVPVVPADRGREAIVTEFGVSENLSLAVLSRLARLGWVQRKAERIAVANWLQTMEVKTSSAEAPITTLSGGNQQKVVIGRCLARNPQVLVLCEPTAGVDVGTRQAIYKFIADRARNGLALVVSSSDIDDLLAMCTRVLVMCNGRVARELAGDEVTEKTLLDAMEEIETGQQ